MIQIWTWISAPVQDSVAYPSFKLKHLNEESSCDKLWANIPLKKDLEPGGFSMDLLMSE